MLPQHLFCIQFTTNMPRLSFLICAYRVSTYLRTFAFPLSHKLYFQLFVHYMCEHVTDFYSVDENT